MKRTTLRIHNAAAGSCDKSYSVRHRAKIITTPQNEEQAMITPYLNYSGNCEAAFKYYEKHLGGKVDMMMRYADAPPDTPVPQEHKNFVMHAHMTIGDAFIMGADAPPDRFHKPM